MKKTIATIVLLILYACLVYLDFQTGPIVPFSTYYILIIALTANYISISLSWILTAISILIRIYIITYVPFKELNPLYMFLYYFQVIFIFIITTTLITISIKQYRLIRELSILDPLTNLLNPIQFNKQLLIELERSKRYKRNIIVLYLDIDNFASVNNIHGHKYGDNLLINVASILKSSVRKLDIIGRVGGDEFVIFCMEYNECDISSITSRIHNQLSNIYVTASIGVIRCDPTNACNPNKIVEYADSEMYKAKRNGRNQVSIRDMTN